MSRPIIRLLPVSVPDYLDTQDILLRSGRNEVKANPTGRWAERLSVGLTHALAAALASRLPAADIVANRPIVPPAQQILVDVETFEISPDGQCQLTGRWTISSGDGLRVLRSGRGSREGSNLKEKLAEHLGINEARVGKYLKDHCGVRWLQLDEGAPLLAHFAVAVLRPISNE